MRNSFWAGVDWAWFKRPIQLVIFYILAAGLLLLALMLPARMPVAKAVYNASNNAGIQPNAVAVDDNYTAVEGTTLNADGTGTNPAGVKDNDQIVSNDNLYDATIVTNPLKASAFTLNTDGTFSYTPTVGATGTDTFTYFLCENFGPLLPKSAKPQAARTCFDSSNTATVTITIRSMPVANPDSYTTIRNTPLNADGGPGNSSGVLANDTNPNAGTRTVSKVSDVTHGTLTLNTDGTFIYNPANNYVGSDSFQYKFNDGFVDSNVTTATIVVKSSPPIANNDTYTTPINTALSVPAASGVLANDSDPNTPPLPLTAAKLTDPANGTLTFNSDGSFNYLPNTGFNGTDSFTYKANNGVFDSNSATVLINVGTALPSATISDASVLEGDVGTRPMVFTITFSVASSTPVTITYSTSDGSAKAGTDYLAASSGATLVIPAGQTSGTITVLIIGNTIVDGNRAFFVNLTGVSGAVLSRNRATGTIIDDDSGRTNPTLTINDVQALEGNTGTTPFTFVVNLVGGGTTPITVSFVTGDGTARAGTDYQPISGTVTFGPGETTKTLTVLGIANTFCEPNRGFRLTLSGPTGGATLVKPVGIGTIIDDDCTRPRQEADLLPILRVSPDREYGLSSGTLVTYTLVIKNLGPGRASPPAARFPLDPNLEVAYATFAQPNSWVEKIVTANTEPVHDPDAALPYLQIRFPQMEVNDVVTATLVFRAAPWSRPDHSLFTRFVAVWDDDVAVNHHRFSNGVRFTLTPLSVRNDTGGVVQFFTPDVSPASQDKTGLTHIVLNGDFYAFEERIYLWYTDPKGVSTGLGYTYANREGQVTLDLYVAGLLPGQAYTFIGLGGRTGVTGSAIVQLLATSSLSSSGAVSKTVTYRVSPPGGDQLRRATDYLRFDGLR